MVGLIMISPINVIEGNWGPDSTMTAALSSYTPNIPWAKIGCSSAIRQNGEGTSASTPQVAAAVALWYEKHKKLLPRDWRRVEAVRHALFSSAASPTADPAKLGRGILLANAALAVAPVLNLPKTPADSDSFAFLRVLTGLGIVDMPPRERMFNLRARTALVNESELQEAVPDPAADVSRDALRRFMDAVIGDGGASQVLRKHVASRYPLYSEPRCKAPPEIVAPPRTACTPNITMPAPPYRRIRTYAVDPSYSAAETASINEATLTVRWEDLQPGPSGDYLKVIDTDAAGVTYAPVNLNDPRLLAQRMQAGRRQSSVPPTDGLCGRNEDYQPFRTGAGKTSALARRHQSQKPFRRQQVRTQADRPSTRCVRPMPITVRRKSGCSSAISKRPPTIRATSLAARCTRVCRHDIIAHETTHAILDGMHSRFNEATNPDVLAFHETFADIVALMQHFTIPEILENEINRTRGNLGSRRCSAAWRSSSGGRLVGAARCETPSARQRRASGHGISRPQPNITPLAPHARGALLVAAVFDAFLAIYKTRTADLCASIPKARAFCLQARSTPILYTGWPERPSRLPDTC